MIILYFLCSMVVAVKVMVWRLDVQVRVIVIVSIDGGSLRFRVISWLTLGAYLGRIILF